MLGMVYLYSASKAIAAEAPRLINAKARRNAMV
jgi:hypothetical protein